MQPLVTVGADRASAPPAAPETEAAEASAHTFTFDGITIPAVLVEGTLWLAATQLCRALKLPITNKCRASRYLGKLPPEDVDQRYLMGPTGGLQERKVVTLAGALALTKERTRRVDQRVRAMLNRETKSLPIAQEYQDTAPALIKPQTEEPIMENQAAADIAPPCVNPPETGAITHTLTYGPKPIRFITVDGRIWFVAADVYGMSKRPLDREAVAAFVCTHRSRHLIATETGPQLLHTVSPLGAQTIAAKFPYPNGGIAYLWFRKHVGALELPDGGSAPKLSYAILADGNLPPKPKLGQEMYAEWAALAASQAPAVNSRHPMLRRPFVAPNWPIDRKFYALPDDDTAPRIDLEAAAAEALADDMRCEALIAGAGAALA